MFRCRVFGDQLACENGGRAFRPRARPRSGRTHVSGTLNQRISKRGTRCQITCSDVPFSSSRLTSLSDVRAPGLHQSDSRYAVKGSGETPVGERMNITKKPKRRKRRKVFFMGTECVPKRLK